MPMVFSYNMSIDDLTYMKNYKLAKRLDVSSAPIEGPL